MVRILRQCLQLSKTYKVGSELLKIRTTIKKLQGETGCKQPLLSILLSDHFDADKVIGRPSRLQESLPAAKELPAS